MAEPAFEDFLKQAKVAAPDEARARLAEAERVVVWDQEWVQLAAVWAPLDAAEARRCLGIALDRHAGVLWVARKAADVFLGALGDREAAKAALDRCAAALETKTEPIPTQGYEWQLLAEGYRVQLGDEAGALRCLERARGPEASLDDLCSAARGYGRVPAERARATELLAQAEAMAVAGKVGRVRSQVSALWGIAVVHFDLDEGAAGERVLRLAATLARDFDDHHNLAIAWYRRSPVEVGAALDCALALVTTAGEATKLAYGCHEYGGGAERIARTLARGRELATTLAERVDLAASMRQLTGDAAAADAYAPRGIRPSEQIATRAPVPGFEADPDPFFAGLCARVSSATLDRIARADYGQDYEHHLARLVDIQSTGLVPPVLPWEPREVLELFRYGTGLSVDHLGRAFACAILCLSEAGPDESRGYGLESDLSALLESTREVGLVDARLVAFLAAIASGTEASDRLLALAALRSIVQALDPNDARLAELDAEVARVEAARNADDD